MNFAKLVMTKTHANLGGLMIMVLMGVSHEALCIDGAVSYTHLTLPTILLV